MMPKNDISYLFMVGTLICSSILNAILFGDMAGLVINITRVETYIQQLNDTNNSVMSDIKLDSMTK